VRRARTLAADSRRIAGALRSLRRAAAQRAAATRAAVSDARAGGDELSADGAAAAAMNFV